MAGQAGLLELSAGSELLLDGAEWTVAAVEAQHGRVLLRSGGEERWRSIRWLAHQVSDTAVDIAMLPRDIMMPLPMRDGWGPEMEWPYPGVPASVVAEFAGHRVAGLPFFAPETVTTDHGGPCKSHLIISAQKALGCNILPARVLRPQDRAACEQAFGALRSLLFEHLPGYTGIVGGGSASGSLVANCRSNSAR
jgi:hypothetical protein